MGQQRAARAQGGIMARAAQFPLGRSRTHRAVPPLQSHRRWWTRLKKVGASPTCKSGSWTPIQSRTRTIQDASNRPSRASPSKRPYLWSNLRRSMRGFETRFVCVCSKILFLPSINFDECLRQVPIDPAHVRSFLNTAVFGTFVTKITIMHAYQTCIKRIVRFANSLQVRSLTTLKNSDPISSGLCRAPAWRYAKTSCSQHSEFQKKKSSIHLKV